MKRPNTIESVLPGSGEYSFMADMRLNFWFLVSLATEVGVRLSMSGLAEWNVGSRVSFSLLPLIPATLLVRSFKRFVCGLDELQRRVQVELMLFATSGTLFIATVLSVLNTHGVSTGGFENGLGISGVLMSTITLWFLASYLTHRRFRAPDEK